VILETKYNIGQKVWAVYADKWSNRKSFHTEGPLTIGKVIKEVTDSPGIEGEDLFDNYKKQKKDEEKYMCIETGIGTGTLHSVEKLFPSKEEAREFADHKTVTEQVEP